MPDHWSPTPPSAYNTARVNDAIKKTIRFMDASTKIGFIGGGNMARCLIAGLRNSGWSGENIFVAEPDADKRDYFTTELQVYSSEFNDEVVAASDTVVLAVKPQILREVSQSLADVVQLRQPLVVSIAAGIRATDLERWLGGNVAIVRGMPNTPALVGSGATGLCANTQVDEAQRETAESILRSVGITVWLETEAQLDTVTALSGSGPAYFMLIMESLERAGTVLGIPPEVAHLLVLETCLGAAKLAMESEEDLAELRKRVTSPGGTTEKAIEALQRGRLPDVLAQAVKAARERAAEMAQQFGAY